MKITQTSKPRIWRTAVLVGAAVALTASAIHSGHAASITFFPPTAFSANTATMDQNLGTTGFVIEDFEDTTLIPGLTISFTGNGYNTTRNDLARTLTRADTAKWDGTHFIDNDPENIEYGNTIPILAARTTFNFPSGVTSFGVGLLSFQSVNPPSDQFPVTDHRLYLNGVPFASTLEVLAGANWVGSAFGRNGYLRIDAATGETITSVGFENISGNDGIIFDHLAVVPTPEPSCFVLLTLGAGFLCARPKKQNHKCA